MKIAKRITLGLLALILCGSAATVYSYWHQGYRMYIIHTGSMIPTYEPGSVVIDKPVNVHDLHKGEPITFLHSALSDDTVTHRVHGFTSTGLINTKGDANSSPDGWHIRPNQVKGTVVKNVPDLGFVIYFLKQRDGDAAVVTAFFTLWLLWGLFFEDAEPRAELIDETDKSEDVADETITLPDTVSVTEPHTVIDIRTEAEKDADAVLAGIRQLRGRHRAPRGGGDRIEVLRGPGRHRADETALVGAMHAIQRPAPAFSSEMRATGHSAMGLHQTAHRLS